MFCPKCKVEYRPGFTRCSDCEVDLVDVLPEEDLSSDEALTMLWECADQAECVGVCRDLGSADIRYHVDEIPYEKTAKMSVKWRYRILISPNDLDRAKELLSIDAPQNAIPSSDAEDEEVVDPTVELADAAPPLTVEPKRRDRYLDPWYPEDARSGLKTPRTFPLGLSALWTPTIFIAAAILISLGARKSSYGPKTSPSPVKSSARSSKALRSSSSCS